MSVHSVWFFVFFLSAEAVHRFQCKATLASADEVPAIIARS